MGHEVADQNDMGRRAHVMVERLSQIGTGQHAHAGLRGLLERIGLLDCLTKVEPKDVVDSVLLPSTVLRIVNEEHPHEFSRIFGCDSEKLRAFWTNFLARPRTRAWAHQHPHLRRKTVGDLVCTSPCVVHSDAGPCSKTLSANIVSWSALLGSGGENTTKILVCSFLKENMLGDRPSWELLLRDFEASATGMVDGRAVAQQGRKRWKFVLLIAKSDEEAHANEFGLVHYNSPENCGDCLANDSTRPFTDLRRESAWRPTADMEFPAWLSRMRAPHHPLVDHPTCCARWFFSTDAPTQKTITTRFIRSVS